MQTTPRTARIQITALVALMIGLLTVVILDLMIGFTSPSLATAELALDSLANKYGIEIERSQTSNTQGVLGDRLRFDAPSREEVARYSAIFVFEFGAYPVTFIQATDLDRIVLCRRLEYQGRPVQALTGGGTLFLDVVAARYNRLYERAVIHHEFFHIVDMSDDRRYVDPTWERINPTTFRYSGDAWSLRSDDGVWHLDDSLVGFLNRYSTAAVEEDKAEIFAHMMVQPQEVQRRAEGDVIIRSKSDAMRGLLRRMSPDMDDGFWAQIDSRPARPIVWPPGVIGIVSFALLCLGTVLLRRIVRAARTRRRADAAGILDSTA